MHGNLGMVIIKGIVNGIINPWIYDSIDECLVQPTGLVRRGHLPGPLRGTRRTPEVTHGGGDRAFPCQTFLSVWCERARVADPWKAPMARSGVHVTVQGRPGAWPGTAGAC